MTSPKCPNCGRTMEYTGEVMGQDIYYCEPCSDAEDRMFSGDDDERTIEDDYPETVICPECGGDMILFTGFEMYGDEPIAKNYHCEECDTHFSEGYP